MQAGRLWSLSINLRFEEEAKRTHPYSEALTKQKLPILCAFRHQESGYDKQDT